MKRQISFLLCFCLGIALSCVLIKSAHSEVTEFDDIALDGQGTNPFIRFDQADGIDQFIVGFGDNLGFWSGSGYSFRIYDDSRSNTLVTNGTGVGIGTNTPIEMLHLYSSGGSFPEASILVENDQGATAQRDMFRLINNGGTRFSFEDTSLSSKWVFSSDTIGRYSVSLDGTGGPEMAIYPNGRVIMGPGSTNNFDLKAFGDLRIRGTLIQASDKNLKTKFESVDHGDVLNKVAALPISTWQFKTNESGDRHMGPTSQDFNAAFNLGPDDKSIAPVDGIGVSLSAIKALKAELDKKDAQLQRVTSELETQNELLAEVMERLKSLESNAN